MCVPKGGTKKANSALPTRDTNSFGTRTCRFFAVTSCSTFFLPAFYEVLSSPRPCTALSSPSFLPANHKRHDTCNETLNLKPLSEIPEPFAGRLCRRLHSSFQPSLDPIISPISTKHCRGCPCPPCKFLQALIRRTICLISFHDAIARSISDT